MLRRRLFLTQVSILSAISIPALVAVPVQAATIVVNNQGQFDAAVAVATQPGHNDTIDASGAGTIDPGTSLTIPVAATSINLNFDNLGLGTNGGDATMT